ncbi:hypothetical protein SAMN05421740_11063 [Parapedobacter koreensis]|uniref:Stationary phase survival protein SurE n=1 Tax=Parapedobacter koreensis TaxID=332977 RepID=A0A1H7T654_9SPHI|nr:hypothetical protein SAMN05421740_11063 [Parapedobacter koreensis]
MKLSRLQRNSFPFGCLVGLLAPIVAYVITAWFASFNIIIGGKPLGLYVIAALINLLFVRFFYRNGLERSARGVILVTFVSVLLLIFIEKLSLI